ncbi:MAG: helix-turn-helix transcriptional regulator [Bacilli bacterium]|nr:helix-turn-helix transcriptional regulator [Bacilli bacterium]
MSNVNGFKIRDARKELGMSQDALAQKLGVSKVTICWYETGERTPNLKHFLELSDILNLSLDEMVGREISVVSEEDEEYVVRMSKKDIEIINEIKDRKRFYKKLYRNPKKTLDLIMEKMK